MIPLALSLAVLFAPGGEFVRFPPETGRVRVVIGRILDGDTVECYLLTPLSVRLHGINAPEKNTPAGPKSSAYLRSLLPVGTQQTLELRGREKYGRQLGEFWLGPLPVSRMMIRSGHARPWDGRGERPD